MARWALLLVVLAAAAACSKESPATPNDDPIVNGTGNFGNADGGEAVDPQAGCSEEAKLVYVLSIEGDLHSFAPADKKFTKIGPLSCKMAGKDLLPISMAVDRNAVAWVNLRETNNTTTSDGYMFKVDTKTAACTSTKLAGSMGGMGFSTNGLSTDETLFVAGAGALRKVDFATEKFIKVADFLEQVDLELTGTGDGRLFGFLISTPLAVAELNKETTKISGRVKLTTVETPMAPMFAFSFWGGDFYFYTATNSTSAKTSTVSRFRPSDGTVDNAYMKNIGFHIVGAGVSTCAPTTSPK